MACRQACIDGELVSAAQQRTRGDAARGSPAAPGCSAIQAGSSAETVSLRPCGSLAEAISLRLSGRLAVSAAAQSIIEEARSSQEPIPG